MRNPLHSTRTLLAAFAALGAFVSFSTAQTVATIPVGAVTRPVAVGLNAIGLTLTNPDLVVASASANTTSTVTFTGVNNVGALLSAGTLYYLEALSGPLEGDRFDVDTAATITTANGTVALNVASLNNTYSLLVNDAVGSQFALRRHVTLSQVQLSFTTPLIGNNTASLADQIWLLNPTGSAFAQYYLRLDNTSWRLTTGAVNVANTVIIPPGVGFVVQKRTSPATLVTVGNVRVNDFAFPLPVGLSFRAPAYPISYSPASLGGTATLGWTAHNTAAAADQLRVLNISGTAFTSYFLRLDGVTWRSTTGTTNLATTELFAYDSAFLISRKVADNNYILTSPLSI